MSDCLFCKIASKQIPSKIVYEDEIILAFEDIHPQARVHVLVIPKAHISNNLALKQKDKILIGNIFLKINIIAQKLGIAESGFRIINNCGKNAGQEVFHMHWHLLGGEPLGKLITQKQ